MGSQSSGVAEEFCHVYCSGSQRHANRVVKYGVACQCGESIQRILSTLEVTVILISVLKKSGRLDREKDEPLCLVNSFPPSTIFSTRYFGPAPMCFNPGLPALRTPVCRSLEQLFVAFFAELMSAVEGGPHVVYGKL